MTGVREHLDMIREHLLDMVGHLFHIFRLQNIVVETPTLQHPLFYGNVNNSAGAEF